MWTQAKVFFLYAEVEIPVKALLFPVLPPSIVSTWLAEKFNFCLLKLSRAKDKGLRRHFVTKAFAYLSNTKGHFYARALQHVRKVHKDALCGFRPQPNGHRVVDVCAHLRLEHELKLH